MLSERTGPLTSVCVCVRARVRARARVHSFYACMRAVDGATFVLAPV